MQWCSHGTDLVLSSITEILLLDMEEQFSPCVSTFVFQDPGGACCLVCVNCLQPPLSLALIFMGNWQCSTWNQRPAGDGEERERWDGRNWGDWSVSNIFPLFTLPRYSPPFLFINFVLFFSSNMPRSSHHLYIYFDISPISKNPPCNIQVFPPFVLPS